jgi:hypothetical protein
MTSKESEETNLLCEFCSLEFDSEPILNRHIQSAHRSGADLKFNCDSCKLSFNTLWNLKRHLTTKNHLKRTGVPLDDSQPGPSKKSKPNFQYHCFACKKTFTVKASYVRHLKSIRHQHNSTGDSQETLDEEEEHVFNRSGTILTICTPSAYQDIRVYLQSIRRQILKRLREKIYKRRSIRWYVCVKVRFFKHDRNGKRIEYMAHFRNASVISFSVEDLQDQLEQAFQERSLPTHFDSPGKAPGGKC